MKKHRKRRGVSVRVLLFLLSLSLLLFLMPCSARAEPSIVDAFRVLPLTPETGRALVAAALRASGLGTSDARIEAAESRSHESAWLPELRLRVTRTDDDHTTLLFTEPTEPYETAGVRMAYEARLSWRLDRILYSGDEPQYEHLRVIRAEAREKLSKKTLEAFFALEHGLADLTRANEIATPGNRKTLEQEDAMFRAFEAGATLDVLTGGWFSSEIRVRLASRSPK